MPFPSNVADLTKQLADRLPGVDRSVIGDVLAEYHKLQGDLMAADPKGACRLFLRCIDVEIRAPEEEAEQT